MKIFLKIWPLAEMWVYIPPYLYTPTKERKKSLHMRLLFLLLSKSDTTLIQVETWIILYERPDILWDTASGIETIVDLAGTIP